MTHSNANFIRYVILSHARTGSNYLVFSLAQHPAIEAHNEIFHEHTIYLSSGENNVADELAKRDADPVAYLNATLTQSTKPVRGFKHLLFYDEGIITYVLEHDFRVIVLERANILAQYSSMEIAHQTGQWTLHQAEKPVPAPQLDWNETAFEDYRADYLRCYCDLKQRVAPRSDPVLHLWYTELFAPGVMGRIFAFLGLTDSGAIPAAGIRKQNTNQILERFKQPDVVRAYLERIGCPQWAREHV